MINAADIMGELDRYVIGQERAKRTLASAVANHYRATAYRGPVHIQKSNVMLAGSTGSGKTFLVQTIARTLGVPFATENTTSITPAGWAGADPEGVIKTLLTNSRRMFADKKEAWEKAKIGIVYLDEIDKIARQKDAGPGASGGFSPVNVQQALLKVIEGTNVQIEGNPFPTDDILFVASGAFVGIEQLIQRREAGGRFARTADLPHISLRRVEVADIVEFGFIPEFVGRFPVIATLDPLTQDDMVRILRDAKDSLVQQFQARFEAGGARLEIDDSVLVNVARSALTRGTGARGLRSLMEKLVEGPSLDIHAGETLRITSRGIEKVPGESVVSVAACAAPSCDGEPAAALSEQGPA